MGNTRREENKRLLEEKLTIIQSVAILIGCLLLIVSAWLGETVFSYEVEKTVMIREPYEHVVDVIWDYKCYTTTYGECYHESGCRYLYHSSKTTTVEDARNDGYRACSVCDPPIELPVTIKETRYREVAKIETETKEPKLFVCVVSTSVTALVYYIVTYDIRKEIREKND